MFSPKVFVLMKCQLLKVCGRSVLEGFSALYAEPVFLFNSKKPSKQPTPSEKASNDPPPVDRTSGNVQAFNFTPFLQQMLLKLLKTLILKKNTGTRSFRASVFKTGI